VSRIVRRHRLVYRDVIELADHMSRDSLPSAVRFFDNVETTLAGLLEMPGKGSPKHFTQPSLREVRSWPIDGSPKHLIF
jgi:plasmid stabilization system protein ParE